MERVQYWQKERKYVKFDQNLNQISFMSSYNLIIIMEQY